MANRMKEEEKNEKIIRGLLKLPPNRRCINCNSLGPQYVCTNFWTFVCTTCSGIHREFTHRVKSVSMAKFTSQEVSSLQGGGNQRAKEIYFKEWDPQRHLLPESSNVDRLRDFIKNVYVDKRYTGDRAGDRPPRGKMGDRDDTYENRRHDSYQSDSRSPPYEDQYGDRRYGERPGPGARKAEFDRGRYDDKGYDNRPSRYSYDEKRSPGQYESDRTRYDRGYQDNRRYDDTYKRSPARFESGVDRRSEDRFGNGSVNRRFEDRRFPDAPDRRRPEERSPNYQRDFDIGSPPPVRPVRDILGDDVPTLRVSDFPRANGNRDAEGSARSQPDARKEFRGQRTASSSSMGSVDGNSPTLKRVNSGSLIDFSAEPEPPSAAAQQDLFGVSSAPQLSAGVPQDPFAVSSVPQPSTAPGLDNGGWATFDFAPQATPAPAPVPAGPVPRPSAGILDAFGEANNSAQLSGQWASGQQLQGPASFAASVDNWSAIQQSVKPPNTLSGTQSWNGLLSSTAPVPPTALQNAQPPQAAAKQTLPALHAGAQEGQHSTGSTQNGMKEIPEDLFKPAYPEPVLHSAGFQLGSRLGGVSGVQFPSVGMSLSGSMPYLFINMIQNFTR